MGHSPFQQYTTPLFEGFPEPLLVVEMSSGNAVRNRAFRELVAHAGSEPAPIAASWPTWRDDIKSTNEFNTQFVIPPSKITHVKLQPVPLPDSMMMVRVLAATHSNQSERNFHSQRLETLGVLASGIAHDFNNILTGILGHVAFLKTVLPPKGSHGESLSSIEEGSKKAATMTQQILNFSKLDTSGDLSVVNLCDLVGKTSALLKRALAPRYEIEFIPPTKDLFVRGIEGQIAQVIVNLVVNARDASPPDSVIKIELTDQAALPRHPIVDARRPLPHLGFTSLAVVDSGHGMTKEIQMRIFEPYFSTKEGRGTGLGLATVHSIIASHGGAIDVKSIPSHGTTMTIFFPRETGESPAKSHSSGRAVSHRGREHLLVIDDEDSIRSVVAMGLERLGYHVTLASSGQEALALFGEDPDRYDLVVLDMIMPNLSGPDVFRALVASDPSIRVLVSSGYASSEALDDMKRLRNFDFIAKPFTIDELAAQVRRSLDG